jgi:hypothetical protein
MLMQNNRRGMSDNKPLGKNTSQRRLTTQTVYQTSVMWKWEKKNSNRRLLVEDTRQSKIFNWRC